MSSFKAQEIVREFTLGAANAVYPTGSTQSVTEFPDRPVLAQGDKAKFISKMVMSEVLELLLTIEPSEKGVFKIMHEIVDDLDLPSSKIPCIQDSPVIPVIEAQMDAVVDIMYYILDFCTKQGYNIDRILDLVHQANMNKRHEDGFFHKRDDGKVVKPKDWKEADLTSEVVRQMEEGSWPSS
jgi:predicted HAD superfamily Cof-like phosphohydrolase